MKIKLSTIRKLIREVILEDTSLTSHGGHDGRVDGPAGVDVKIQRSPGLGSGAGLAIVAGAAAAGEVGALLDSAKPYAFPVPVGIGGTSGFLGPDDRAGNVRGGSLGGSPHSGDDWQVATGTAVLSVGTGHVLSVDPVGMETNDAGRLVKTRCGGRISLHIDGLGTVIYCHLSTVNIRQGQAVTPGMPIGTSGGSTSSPTSGRSTGPHLHFSLNQSTDVQEYNDLYRQSSGYQGSAPAPGTGGPQPEWYDGGAPF